MKSPASDVMFPPRPTALAHQILGGMLGEGDWVVDATAGNGHDTQFLAECVGETGRVFALDIQAAAIAAARTRVGGAANVEFFQKSHAFMEENVPQASITAVMFNLGYLPGEDHEITTDAAGTLAALDAAARLLKQPGGILSIICYPGHPAGKLEAEAVEMWLADRAETGWRIAKYAAIHTRRAAPFLLVARRHLDCLQPAAALGPRSLLLPARVGESCRRDANTP